MEFRMQLDKLQVCAHAGTEQIIDDPERIVDPRRRALAIEFGIADVSHSARGTATEKKRRQQSVYTHLYQSDLFY
jgi:hypothetical protein